METSTRSDGSKANRGHPRNDNRLTTARLAKSTITMKKCYSASGRARTSKNWIQKEWSELHAPVHRQLAPQARPQRGVDWVPLLWRGYDPIILNPHPVKGGPHRSREPQGTAPTGVGRVGTTPPGACTQGSPITNGADEDSLKDRAITELDQAAR